MEAWAIMSNFGLKQPPMKPRQLPKKLFSFFLQGLIILAPISITIWTVVGGFNWIDSILPNLVYSLVPKWIGTDQFGIPRRIPGLGFVVFIGIALFVGYISPSFIVSRLVDLADKLLEKTPGIKLIYTTIKDFFEAFAGNKRKFDKAVLVSIVRERVRVLTDISSADAMKFAISGGVTEIDETPKAAL